ncbi:MAG: metallophosphoesterase [Thermoleophilia bacterium]|nr:metallophosphoesterase [Thermoleophilia bacterium]
MTDATSDTSAQTDDVAAGALPSTSRLQRPWKWIAQRRSLDVLRIRRVDLRERGLDLGVRIAVASDIHARTDWFPRENVARLVDSINALEGVDLVALLGDFVGDDVSGIDWSAEEYARIEAPVAAVLGNHDHWCDAAYVQGVLEQSGIEVLTNRSMALAELAPAAREGVRIAGIDSCWTRRGSTGPGADADAAFAEVEPGQDVLVLGHEPHLATLHEHVLHLAGHTHCGQVRTPLLGDWTARMHMPRFSNPWPCWLHEVEVDTESELPATHRGSRDSRFVYTTAGVGYSTIDLRAFCPPEVVVIDC